MLQLLGVSMGVNLVGWVAATYLKTEKFYDLFGSGTFLIVSLLSHSRSSGSLRQRIATGLVCIWAARLGSFLVERVMKVGKDVRFDNVKHDPAKFFVYWSVQGLWVFVTLLPTLALHSSALNPAFGMRDLLGFGIWGLGFALEVMADKQKSDFKADPANEGKFIKEGLWGISRHPNYLGEIALWSGLYLSCSTTLTGAQHLVILSPVFVALLITKISGIPLLEASGLKRWGENEEYQRYLRDTPVLFPFTKALDKFIFKEKAKE